MDNFRVSAERSNIERFSAETIGGYDKARKKADSICGNHNESGNLNLVLVHGLGVETLIATRTDGKWFNRLHITK